MKSLSLLCFLCVILCHAMATDSEIQDYRLALNEYSPFSLLRQTIEEDEKCKVAGLQCAECDKAINCIDIGLEKLVQVPAETCDTENNFFCLNGTCSTKPNPKCGALATAKFDCTSVGVFPDPIDCQKFHICYRNSEGRIINSDETCTGSYGYEPISTYCKTKLASGCPAVYPVPLCERAGQSGVLTNKSIFYVCMYKDIEVQGGQTKAQKTVLYPKLFLCANGKSYVGNKCV